MSACVVCVLLRSMSRPVEQQRRSQSLVYRCSCPLRTALFGVPKTDVLEGRLYECAAQSLSETQYGVLRNQRTTSYCIALSCVAWGFRSSHTPPLSYAAVLEQTGYQSIALQQGTPYILCRTSEHCTAAGYADCRMQAHFISECTFTRIVSAKTPLAWSFGRLYGRESLRGGGRPGKTWWKCLEQQHLTPLTFRSQIAGRRVNVH